MIRAMIEFVAPSRFVFIRQMVAAPVRVKIPIRLRKGGKRTHTWSVADWINEFIRVPLNSHHVPAPLIPGWVFGIGIDDLQAYCKDLLSKAAAQTEVYVRRGKTHIRRQKKTQPVMMCVVVSYPDLTLEDTPERRRWLALTTQMMIDLYGEHLRFSLSHSDESMFHAHYSIDVNGESVRRLHSGFAAADAERVKSKKGQAYRAGCQKFIDDYWKRVGDPMGWLRMSPTPRPRLSRSQAQRNRQFQLETEAAELRKRNAELEQVAKNLAAEKAQHQENVTHFDADFADGEEYLKQRMAEIDTAAETLKRERELVQKTKEEFEAKKKRIESEAAAMWNVIGEAAEKTKAWQQEVRDQVALEARVARLRAKIRPDGGRTGSGAWDDDLSDVPL